MESSDHSNTNESDNQTNNQSEYVSDFEPTVDSTSTKHCLLFEPGDQVSTAASQTLEPIAALKEYFGLDQFRPMQESIIKNVIDKKDCLVIMPTGSGKSICYQIPALVYSSGVTIVISPLIALMQDQINALLLNNIAADYISSSRPASENQMVCRTLRDSDTLRLLYIAPERLTSDGFSALLQNLYCAGKLNLFAIDEAHCMSDYGHDFRPDYRKLDCLRKRFATVPIMALTATATTEVQKDILDQLRIPAAQVYLSSFNRPNLFYRVIRRSDATFYQKIQEFIGKSIIIYDTTRKNVERLAKDLCNKGYRAVAYHAGMSSVDRTLAQSQFINDEAQIIVATISYGMGVNKKNVRLVVHYHMPKSIEGYYQETGRAGRDGAESECLLLYGSGDVNLPADGSTATLSKLSKMNSYTLSDQCRRRLLLQYFQENYPESNCQKCDNCVAKIAATAAAAAGPSLRPSISSDILDINILSTVHATDSRFGESHILAILTGKRPKTVLSNKHDQLATYGLESDVNLDEFKEAIRKLVNQRKLSIEIKQSIKSAESSYRFSYSVLKITPEGRQVLSGLSPSYRHRSSRPKAVASSHAKSTAATEKSSTVLTAAELDADGVKTFDALKEIRRTIATQLAVAPFLVLTDATLLSMVARRPTTVEQLSSVPGFGAYKLQHYGPSFLDYFQKETKPTQTSRTVTAAAKPRSEPSQASEPSRREVKSEKSLHATFSKTLDLLKKGKTLSEIAAENKLTKETILNHLERLLAFDCTYIQHMQHLKPSEETIIAVRRAIEQSGQSAVLKPIKEILGCKFSYDDVKLSKLWIGKLSAVTVDRALAALPLTL